MVSTSGQYDVLKAKYPDIYDALDVFTTLILEQDLGVKDGQRTADPDIWDVLFHNAVRILQNDPNMLDLPEDSQPFGDKAEEFYATIRPQKGSLDQKTLRNIFNSFDLEDVRNIQGGGGKKKKEKKQKRKTRKMHRRRFLHGKHHRLSKKKA